MLVLSCAMPMMNTKSSLNINILSEDTTGSRSLETIRFVFTGTGPGDETFTVETYEQSVAVNNLAAGEWTVQVMGYNESGVLVVIGQTPMVVEVYGETELSIALAPVEGEGNISLFASWDGNFTTNPSIVAVAESTDGTETSIDMNITGGNSADGLAVNLPSGFYRVSIQLYDDGELTAGSVWTVMVLDGITSDTAVSFDNLNKTGERIVISDTSFSLAWDTDSATDEYYRIYARERGTYEWTFLEEITAAASPEFEINTSKLAYGTWEFAVSAVEGGVESELHTSMDDNAMPVSGWYIDWIEL